MKVVFYIAGFLLVLTARAQDSTVQSGESSAEKKLTLNGYLKDLQTLTFDAGFHGAFFWCRF